MSDSPRPPFAAVLGLLPPFSMEDLDAAYRERSRENETDQLELDEAYRSAVQYLEFHASRRTWLGEQIEVYGERMELIAEIESHGGRAVLESLDPYLYGLGPDFGNVARRLREIHITGAASDVVERILSEDWIDEELVVLDLADSDVGPELVRRLTGLTRLVALDLRGTTGASVAEELVRELPRLSWLHLGSTPVGWWSRRGIAKTRKGLHVETALDVPCPSAAEVDNAHLRIAQRLAGQ